jgi:hypothetical protein
MANSIVEVVIGEIKLPESDLRLLKIRVPISDGKTWIVVAVVALVLIFGAGLFDREIAQQLLELLKVVGTL